MEQELKSPFESVITLDYVRCKDVNVRNELSHIAAHYEMGQNTYRKIDRFYLYCEDSDERSPPLKYPHLKALMDQHGIDSFILLYWW